MPGPRCSRSSRVGRWNAPAWDPTRPRPLPNTAYGQDGGRPFGAASAHPRRQGDRIGDHTILNVAVSVKRCRSVRRRTGEWLRAPLWASVRAPFAPRDPPPKTEEIGRNRGPPLCHPIDRPGDPGPGLAGRGPEVGRLVGDAPLDHRRAEGFEERGPGDLEVGGTTRRVTPSAPTIPGSRRGRCHKPRSGFEPE